MQLKRKSPTAVVLMVMTLPAAHAAEPGPAGEAMLSGVAVTATRTERREAETPAAITNISRD